jgi:hypothetical protein
VALKKAVVSLMALDETKLKVGGSSGRRNLEVVVPL